MMERKRLCCVVMVLVVLLAAATTNWAGPTTWPPGKTTDSWIARFEAPEQSIWSQGGVMTARTISYSVKETDPDSKFLGSSVGYRVGISSGAVSSNVEGRINASYPSYLSEPDPSTEVVISYAPIADESQIHTTLGGEGRVFGHTKYDMPFPVPDLDFELNFGSEYVGFDVKEDFTTGLGTTTVASGDSTTIASVGADIFVAGVNLEGHLYQDVFFRPLDIDGFVEYTHMETQESEMEPFQVDHDDTPVTVALDLDKPGHWEVAVVDLTLGNTFSQKIGAKIGVSAWAAALGTVASDDVGLALWDNPDFSLLFDEIDMLGRFNIYVDSAFPGSVIPVDTTTGSPAVPAPGAVGLLGVGLSILAAGHRKYHRWVDPS